MTDTQPGKALPCRPSSLLQLHGEQSSDETSLSVHRGRKYQTLSRSQIEVPRCFLVKESLPLPHQPLRLPQGGAAAHPIHSIYSVASVPSRHTAGATAAASSSLQCVRPSTYQWHRSRVGHLHITRRAKPSLGRAQPQSRCQKGPETKRAQSQICQKSRAGLRVGFGSPDLGEAYGLCVPKGEGRKIDQRQTWVPELENRRLSSRPGSRAFAYLPCVMCFPVASFGGASRLLQK